MKEIEMKSLKFFIQSIASYHHYGDNFLGKIKKIILYLKDRIKKTLSDIQIFFIFMNNKAIIQFYLH